MAHAWIGASGFAYRHWIDVLYPRGLPASRWLERYAEEFDAVELNVTFYRLPDERTFAQWRKRTPDDFRFVLKGSRMLTHVKKLREPDAWLAFFFERAAVLANKLACVLWQLPPELPKDLSRLESFLAAMPAAARDLRHAFEFRHPSWFSADVYAALERARAEAVLSDWPIEVLAPGQRTRDLSRPVVRAPAPRRFAYVRRHGPHERYRSGYPDALLRSDARWIRRRADEGIEAFVFYNNDRGGHAVRNARTLARYVGAKAPTTRRRAPYRVSTDSSRSSTGENPGNHDATSVALA